MRLGVTDDKAVLVAKVYKPNSSGSANVVAEYGHVELSASIVDVNFSFNGKKFPTIGFTVSFFSKINKAIPAYTDFTY